MEILLADENFPKRSYEYLQDRGYDIKHITSEGFASITDEEVIEIALSENRIIVTFDSDFGELIFRKGYKPSGVLFFRWKNFRPQQPGEFIDQLLSNQQVTIRGFLTVISEQTIRQRKI